MAKISQIDALKMLEEAFEESAGALQPDTPRDDIIGWDSMGALALMAELDSRFNLVLTAEQSKKMRRVSDVLDYLRAQDVLEG